MAYLKIARINMRKRHVIYNIGINCLRLHPVVCRYILTSLTILLLAPLEISRDVLWIPFLKTRLEILRY